MILEGPVGLYLKDLIDNLLDEIENENDKRALDLGCGYGYYTVDLLQRGYEVDAVDISDHSIEMTRNKIEEMKNHPKVEIHNINALDFESKKKYDLIICFEMLEHLHEVLKLLKLINTWLKDGGILLISVPHNENLWNIRDEQAGHLRRYSKDEIKEKLKKANLEPIKILCYGFPLIRLFLGTYLKIQEMMMNRAKEGQTREKARTSPLSRMKKISAPILKVLFKFDNLFINGDRGFGLVVMAQKKSQ
ncbi:MAG TPA: class I SAM-dependent methyltransferase [Methanothermobacter sp.]|nr:SAM-binding motif [Methanothermobacter sp. MT-2]HHW04812.1 class I SAM-dependent methyltransferase [Methanothermobacter sp.]HOK72177.1 class I SAM-dependent methyltransferase [Methanothermobacter sp.]HOL68490.1 class I SAM-dependent methyltransferase [Methanothermobacter sp.]HPQ04249.1 class I SAM-dependent methyltransferase [Methanothermobacter sp.]